MASKPELTEKPVLGFLMRVTDYLSELTQANKKLLKILKDYQDLLVDGSTTQIQLATPRLDRAAVEIRVIDENRRAFVNNFFEGQGWDGPRNFSAIARRVREAGVTDEEALAFERASAARMELISILAHVDAQNSLNLTLIGQGMTFSEVSLKAILGMNDKPATYGPSPDRDDGPSLLDAQA